MLRQDRLIALALIVICLMATLGNWLGGVPAQRPDPVARTSSGAADVAKQGYKVGFLDGSRVLQVRMYEGFWETWREWGRSLDLKDATSIAQLWGDHWFLLSVQGLPIWLCLTSLFLPTNPVNKTLFWVNLCLIFIRWGMLLAIRPVYAGWNQNSWLFWLSPLADSLAVLRIILSSLTRPKTWRGRYY